MNITRRLAFLSLLLIGPTCAAAQSPWQAHGPIQVSGSGHALEHRDGTPFLWVADTAWGLFQQLTREDVDQYLDNRQTLGFTVIQSVAFWYPHGGGLKEGPHNAANAYGHRPFRGGDDAPDTAAPLVIDGRQPLTRPTTTGITSTTSSMP